MKTLVILHLSISLLACHDEQRKEKIKSFSTETKEDLVYAKGVRKYIQYKKVPVMNNNDTVPYRNCYILIKEDSLFYYRLNKRYEKHLLVDSKKNGKEVYTFNDKPGELLFFTGKNQEYCQWLRANFEGDYEYFKLSK